MKTKKSMAVNRKNHLGNQTDLVDVLYLKPAQIAEWFSKRYVDISLEDCEKLSLDFVS